MDLPSYSLAERDRRWDLARRLMDAEGVDALVVHGGAGWAPDAYLTNDRPGAIVVFPRAGEPVMLVGSPAHVGDHLLAGARGDAQWIRPENVLVAKHAHGVAETLRAHGLSRSPVGVLGLEPCPPSHADPLMPYALWSSVLQQLPQLTARPVERAFVTRALPQSGEELACVRRAAAVGESMARAMLEAVRPGVSEAALYAAAVAECLRQGAVPGDVSIVSGREPVSCGPPAWSYRPQPPRLVEDGDLVLAELSVRYGLREARQRLTIAVGDVHPGTESPAKTARASYEAGLATLRPGRLFGEVVTAMREAGGRDPHSLAGGRHPHSLADGRHPHPLVHSLNPSGVTGGSGARLGDLPRSARYGLLAEQPTIGSDLPLAPGMTFALTPTCASGGHLAGLGGTVVVGDDAPIELNTITTHLMRSTR
ncbi:M24 family metallopeptidase [Nonomuraea sp. FMUSA5-5]|uniref:M24 family metallopeptidase n=1 Tax=Nonomuraea composti TaxID=2720023 RepID=A0ABX1B275_9ACTN|nr:M24 family metallopeptidase [Nonomuraea sp. FMUSA5-5]NJP91436.1 M24 family metallopeptidase [Nonomuraea sp. FMUSA5-5]